MFLHIGDDCSVPVKDIALILDYGAEMPEGTRKSLNLLKSIDAGDTRRSAVVTTGAVYYSPIAKGTLRKRLQRIIKLICAGIF
jgi:hypothetical protein